MARNHDVTPRLLRRERGAQYLDISTGSFDKLVAAGKIPAPKMMEGFKVWDRLDLDRYVDELPPIDRATPETESDRSNLDRLLRT
jgi:hypothetical protein